MTWEVSARPRSAIGLSWGNAASTAIAVDPYFILFDINGGLDAYLTSQGQRSFVGSAITVLLEIRDRDRFLASMDGFVLGPAAAGLSIGIGRGSTVRVPLTHTAWMDLFASVNNPPWYLVALVPPTPQALKKLLELANDVQSGITRVELSAPRDLNPQRSQPSPEPTPREQVWLTTTPNWAGAKLPDDLFLRWATVNEKLKLDFNAFSSQAELGVLAPSRMATSPLNDLELRATSLPQVFVAVLDDRCNYAGYTGDEVATVWDQSTDQRKRGRENSAFVAPTPALLSTGRQWGGSRAADAVGTGRKFDIPKKAAYGRVLDRTATRGPEPDEPHCYRRDAFFHPPHHWSHGAAVLHVVASSRIRISNREVEVSSPTKVHLVQFPEATVLDTGGGSLASHALDGIVDSVQRAPAGAHVIVNLSFGTHGGAHDGTSMFESALRWLLDFYDGSASAEGKRLHVVVPAGNTQRWRCHAAKLLIDQTDELQLQWRILPDNPAPGFVEIWSDQPEAVFVEVQPPGASAIRSDPGSIQTWQVQLSSGQTEVMGAVISVVRATQGSSGGMTLVAVAPTHPGAYQATRPMRNDLSRKPLTLGGRAPHGVWDIRIGLRPGARRPVSVHAWVQRSDAAPARSRDLNGFDDRQTYFVEGVSGDVGPEFTLNGIATLTHERYFVVGAMREIDHGLSSYSAAGPERGGGLRTEGPDIVEAIDHSVSLPGLLVGGGLSGSRARISGTSIAAAIFSRRLFLHLSQGNDAATLRPLPPWHLPATRDPPVTPADPKLAVAEMRGEFRRMPPLA